MLCAAIAISVSLFLLLIIGNSQMVLAIFICLQGFGAVVLFWAGFSMMLVKRIEQGKDVLVFQRRARNVLLVVGFLPLFGVVCLIMELF